jgi:hypothetical protein
MDDLLEKLTQRILQETFAVGDDRASAAGRTVTTGDDGSLLVDTDPPALVGPILAQESFEIVSKIGPGAVRYARQLGQNPVELLQLEFSPDRPSDPRDWLHPAEQPAAPRAYILGHPHGAAVQ